MLVLAHAGITLGAAVLIAGGIYTGTDRGVGIIFLFGLFLLRNKQTFTFIKRGEIG